MILSLIYRTSLYGDSLSRRLAGMVRRAIIRANMGALCTMTVHGRKMLLPFDHPLPSHLMGFPFYDRLPVRIASFIRAKSQPIRCIDVGANIGDTIAALNVGSSINASKSSDVFLAVEPNPRFRNCLRSNWGHDKRVIVLDCLCSSVDGGTSACISESPGTASINPAHDMNGRPAIAFAKRTIDSILGEYGKHGPFNFLKIDTDGHDFEVLNGAKQFIARDTPFLYFEVDAFLNPNFIDDCLNALRFLNEVGYKRLLIYDNLGSLMGVFETGDVPSIKKLLFYKMTKTGYYFDFLLMRDSFVDEFYKLETEYFVSATESAGLTRPITP